MAELKEIVSARLQQLFQGETDEMTASKLVMSTGNANKIKNGKQLPTADTLVMISKKYGVSVDWILGIKEDKEIDGENFLLMISFNKGNFIK